MLVLDADYYAQIRLRRSRPTDARSARSLSVSTVQLNQISALAMRTAPKSVIYIDCARAATINLRHLVVQFTYMHICNIEQQSAQWERATILRDIVSMYQCVRNVHTRVCALCYLHAQAKPDQRTSQSPVQPAVCSTMMNGYYSYALPFL